MLKRTDLSADQRAAIKFIQDGEDSLMVADIGTGKTVISLTATYNIRNLRWLVLAPKLVATATWAQEGSQWEHLAGVRIGIAIGDEKQRRKVIDDFRNQYVVMNYENLPWLMDAYPKNRKGDTLPFTTA